MKRHFTAHLIEGEKEKGFNEEAFEEGSKESQGICMRSGESFIQPGLTVRGKDGQVFVDANKMFSIDRNPIGI